MSVKFNINITKSIQNYIVKEMNRKYNIIMNRLPLKLKIKEHIYTHKITLSIYFKQRSLEYIQSFWTISIIPFEWCLWA